MHRRSGTPRSSSTTSSLRWALLVFPNTGRASAIVIWGGGFLIGMAALLVVTALQDPNASNRFRLLRIVGFGVCVFVVAGWKWRQRQQMVVNTPQLTGGTRYEDPAMPGWSLSETGDATLDRTRLREAVDGYRARLAASEEVRLMPLLGTMAQRIGSLTVEEAYWVFVPPAGEPAIEAAMGAPGRMPHTVAFDPSTKDLAEFRQRTQAMRWILHLHNHPRESTEQPFMPSSEDQGFAGWYKDTMPELAGRMRFFIVDAGRILEYGLMGDLQREWLSPSGSDF